MTWLEIKFYNWYIFNSCFKCIKRSAILQMKERQNFSPKVKREANFCDRQSNPSSQNRKLLKYFGENSMRKNTSRILECWAAETAAFHENFYDSFFFTFFLTRQLLFPRQKVISSFFFKPIPSEQPIQKKWSAMFSLLYMVSYIRELFLQKAEFGDL